MTPKKVHAIYFSPTHSSKQIAESIVRGTGVATVETTDLTLQSVPSREIPLDEPVVIAVPVYGGKVAPLALERLDAISSQGAPVVIVVVYGNRAYEQALTELDRFVTSRGFNVIGAATFIGEHSYSNANYPVSAGRPDARDNELAYAFGRRIIEKINSAQAYEQLYPVDPAKIKRPKQPFFTLIRFARKAMEFRKKGLLVPVYPVNDPGKCIHCGKCVKNCPAGAIPADNELVTLTDKCIKCCACVKVCPEQARTFNSAFSILLSEYFKKQKEPQVLL